MSSDEKKELDQTRSARRVCELFRGRFSEDIAIQVIEELGGELQAVDFLLNEKEDEVSKFLKKNPDYVEEMRKDSKKIASLLENGIEYEIRQFACASCNSTWWKKVPDRKQVAKCKKCKGKYDPVPKDKEWGWAKFVCVCSNEFHAYGEMGVTQSRCYQCDALVSVIAVLPPRRRIGSRKKSDKHHSCTGENCFNHDDLSAPHASMNMTSFGSQHRSSNNTFNITSSSSTGDNATKKKKPGNSGGSGGVAGQAEPKAPVCLHPLSNHGSRKFRTASKRHVSTGSTVDTFLTQGSLETASVSLACSLTSINEQGE